MTTVDKIRQMSNEELAEWLDNKARTESCRFCICMSSLFFINKKEIKKEKKFRKLFFSLLVKIL